MGLPTSQTIVDYEKLVGNAARIHSLASFDHEVERLAQAWRSTTGGQPKLWFRGHADSKWFLSPPTLRDPEFQKQYEYERHSFIDFKRRSIGLVHADPRSQWGWLYLAQHHGLPTRLLDWTEGSHIALFFAIGSRKVTDATESCVWVLNPGALNERLWGFPNVVTVDDDEVGLRALLKPYVDGKAPEDASGKSISPLAIIPEYVTPRLRAQRGVFVAFGGDESALVREVLDDASKTTPAPLCAPLVIDSDYAQEIERELDNSGVAASTVFPDIDGLCAELSRRYLHGRL